MTTADTAFTCQDCHLPLDQYTCELVPMEAAKGEATCLRCFYSYHVGTPTPTQDQLPEGWELEEWIDLPVRSQVTS
jgi:hypothetical protein